jgi:hypothetical protein
MTRRRQAPRRKVNRRSSRQRQAARPAVTVKDTRTYYDPVRKIVIDARGNTVTAVFDKALTTMPPVLTREQHVDRFNNMALLYACETATPKTVAGLAKVANCSVAELEWRRRSWSSPTMAGVPIAETWCGRHATDDISAVPLDRRLCLSCPLWLAPTNKDASPF